MATKKKKRSTTISGNCGFNAVSLSLIESKIRLGNVPISSNTSPYVIINTTNNYIWQKKNYKPRYLCSLLKTWCTAVADQM